SAGFQQRMTSRSVSMRYAGAISPSYAPARTTIRKQRPAGFRRRGFRTWSPFGLPARSPGELPGPLRVREDLFRGGGRGGLLFGGGRFFFVVVFIVRGSDDRLL